MPYTRGGRAAMSFRRYFSHLICAIGILMAPLSLAGDGDWLSVIHTSDIQSHFDESGASAKACSLGAYCFGGVPRLVKMVRDERAKSQNVLVLDAGGLFNTALINNPSATELLTDLVSLIGYDAMALGQPELIGDLESLQRYVSLVGAPFVCTGGLVPPVTGNATPPMCNSSLLLTAGSIKVGIVSYLSPNVPELQYHSPPEGVHLGPVGVVKEEASRLRAQGARLIIALVYTSWQLVSHNMSDITHEFGDVDLAVAGNAGHLFFNGAAPHGEVVSGPYPAVWDRGSSAPLLVVSSQTMLHYAGRLQLKVAPEGGCSEWRATNPQLLLGRKDAEAEAVMARHRTSQDALLGGLVGRSMYLLEGGAHCRGNECALGTLVADAMLEASIQPEYKGNDILAWTRAGTVAFEGSVVQASIAAGLVREEDLRVALPLNDHLVIVSVIGSRLVEVLESAVRTAIYSGLQVSGLRLRIKPDPDDETRMKVHSMKVLCTVCQMPAFKDINHRYTYRIVSTRSCVKRILSKAGGALHYETLNITLREAARRLMRKLSPLVAPREERMARLSVLRETVKGGARTTRGVALREAGAVVGTVLVLAVVF